MAEPNDEKTRQTRLIARIIREELHAGDFETLADLTDAIKTRCAKLKIPLNADVLNDAYTLIDSNRPLTGRWPLPNAKPSATRDQRPLSRDESAAILAKIYANIKTIAGPRVTERPTDHGPIDIYGRDE